MQAVLAGLLVAVLWFVKNLQRARCNIDVVSPSWRERLSRKPYTTSDLVRRGYNTVCCEVFISEL